MTSGSRLHPRVAKVADEPASPHLDQYTFLSQIGAGPEWVAYRGRNRTSQELVEIRVLARSPSTSDGWEACAKRLRQLALLDHRSARQILELGLHESPPFFCIERCDHTTLAAEVSEALPLDPLYALSLGVEIADVLAAAHRLGLFHGGLGPATIYVSDMQAIKLDFSPLIKQTDVVQDGPESDSGPFRAPEQGRGGLGTEPASDVYSLATLLTWMLTGDWATRPEETQRRLLARLEPILHSPERRCDLATSLVQLIQSALCDDPTKRPAATEVARVLGRGCAMLRSTGTVQRTLESYIAADDDLENTFESEVVPSEIPQDELVGAEAAVAEQLGRFRLLEKLGEGGMGTAYKAEDLSDGALVAVKLLRADLVNEPAAVQRFQKEARLLAEVNNPNVANLIEVNQDRGVHYIAMQYVEGTSLRNLLRKQGRFPERVALSILTGVARSLVDAHRQGIVHRDIKPDNIALVGEDLEITLSDSDQWVLDLPRRVRLLDFGIARHVTQSESVYLTQTGALLGTPLYMAPEQCSGSSPVDARTDVYAMGVTLYQLLAGRTPFEGNETLKMIAMHCNEPPPSLRKLNPELSDGVVQLVEKALAKHPDTRYPDAGALLDAIERLLRGESSPIAVHPLLPPHDSRRVFQEDWFWDLDASPDQLWPFVSNTERLNRAAGLPPVEYTTQVDPQRGARRFGTFRLAGLSIAWEEHPYEWIEGQRMGILREFSKGPFRWFLSVVELSPRLDGGTRLRHSVRIEPRGLLGRLVAAMEVRIKGKRSLNRIYRRIDAVTKGRMGSRPSLDPFEEPESLPRTLRRRFEERLGLLAAWNINPDLVEKLGDVIEHAPAQEIARIRPYALAERLGHERVEVVEASLRAVQEGLLLLCWDILCPTCRVAADTKDTLRAIENHGHCEVCNLDFELDFGNSIEMILRVHPEVREAALGKYCIGGPEHSPHVVAQVRAAAGETVELELALTEGEYLIRGPQLPQSCRFRVQPGRKIRRWHVTFAAGLAADPIPPLGAGAQILAITNGFDREIVVRIERTLPRDDVLTAAEACSLALFRELFPYEILSRGQLADVAAVNLLMTELDSSAALYRELGDARAFAVVEKHFQILGERIRREGGAVVKSVGEGILASFNEPVAAVRAGLAMQQDLSRSDQTSSLRLRVGIAHGTAMATTLNDRMDYFGATVHLAARLPQHAQGGEMVLTQAIAADPLVASLLNQRGIQPRIFHAEMPSQKNEPLQRVALPGSRISTS